MPSGGIPSGNSGLIPAHQRPVGDVMRRDFVSASVDESISGAIFTMSENLRNGVAANSV